jgi:ferredoxin
MSEVTFVLPDGKRKGAGQSDRHLNLLAHAQMIELDIGSECGGHGICGKDRLRIEDQSLLSTPTAGEREHLTKEDLANGIRLGCQCFPQKDGAKIEASIFP